MRRDALCFYKRIQKLRSLISYSALPLYIKVPTNRMEILVTGTSGVGKSTLVNALVGKRVANTGDQLLRDGSEYVKSYEGTSEGGVEIVVWDSPGLEDGQGKENEYLNELKKKCGNVDVVIYCVDLSATRSYGLSAAEVAPNDLSAVKKLTATFGSNWWKRSVFAMTRANVLQSALKVKPDVDKRFNGRLQEWKERIHATLIATGVPREVAYTIPVEPVGHPKKPRLPGREKWLDSLWRIILTSATVPTDEGNGTPDLIDPRGYESTCEDVDGQTTRDTVAQDRTCDQGPVTVAPINPTCDSEASTGPESYTVAPINLYATREELPYSEPPKSRKEILITGTSGVGKSTLVSGLVGKQVTNQSRNVTGYRANVNVSEEENGEGMEIVVWDSPGLEDGSGREVECLTELKEKCSNVDIVIYCIDLSATRSFGLSAAEIAPNDLCAIKKLTATFGSGWWKRSIFVMTRADVLETALNEQFSDRVQDWKQRIHATLLATGVPEEVACKIPVQPVGRPTKPRLPDRENWLGRLRHLILTSATLVPQGYESTSEARGPTTLDSVTPINPQGRQSTHDEVAAGTMTAGTELAASASSPVGATVESASFREHRIGGIVVYLRKVGREKLI